MASATLKSQLFDKLHPDHNTGADDAGRGPVEITPSLALAVSVLYMMSVDGEIMDEESSQLQSIIGGNDVLLHRAIRYVQAHEVDTFLAQAPAVLTPQHKLCILTNVCDSLLSDGDMADVELALFDRMLKAFGHTVQSFKPYQQAIAIKHNKSVLGAFDPDTLDVGTLTPHLAFAAALLYMMAADGSIEQEEIGQLQAVVAEFSGLQKVALHYVRVVKMNQFLREAPKLLNAQSKLCILTNVCDSLLSDGRIEKVEQTLFNRMLSAFGHTETSFAPFFDTMAIKNDKPAPDREIEERELHLRVAAEKQGEIEADHLNAVSAPGDTLHAKSGAADAANQEAWVRAEAANDVENRVQHTMHENVQKVSEGFGQSDNLAKIGQNAAEQENIQKIAADPEGVNLQQIDDTRQAQNLQKVENASDAPNLQQVDTTAAGTNRQQLDSIVDAANRQQIAPEAPIAHRQKMTDVAAAPNVQQLDAPAQIKNQQKLATADTAANRQALGAENLADTRARKPGALTQGVNRQLLAQDDVAMGEIPQEVRVQNLYGAIDDLNKKLDQFEKENKSFLKNVIDIPSVQIEREWLGLPFEDEPTNQQLLTSNLANHAIPVLLTSESEVKTIASVEVVPPLLDEADLCEIDSFVHNAVHADGGPVSADPSEDVQTSESLGQGGYDLMALGIRFATGAALLVGPSMGVW